MDARGGTYILILRSEIDASLQIGRWGSLEIQPGNYLYVGSAFGPGGVRARVSRHWRSSRNRHWHIDYLRQHLTPIWAWYCHSPDQLEHGWAEALARLPGTSPVPGFGCSDCSCSTHLFFTAQKPKLKAFAELVADCVLTWAGPK